MGFHWNLNTLKEVNMKAAILSLACLVSAISADITCDDCLVFSGNMQTYLMSDESVAEQTELLVALLCPSAPDSADCEAQARNWWLRLLWPCSPSSWRPTTSVVSLAPARSRLCWENPPARSALDLLLQLLTSSEASLR